MNRILDACAITAFLRNEIGANVVEDIVRDPGNHCYAHAVNLCEVYYNFRKTDSAQKARRIIKELQKIGVTPRHDMSKAFWFRIGELKHSIRKISIADCFALALSEKLGGDVVTSDHHEFDPVAAANLARVTFIR
jgi:PIN domain nuclease of toxin-antitoxin system